MSRTVIGLDDDLVEDVAKALGTSTKRHRALTSKGPTARWGPSTLCPSSFSVSGASG